MSEFCGSVPVPRSVPGCLRVRARARCASARVRVRACASLVVSRGLLFVCCLVGSGLACSWFSFICWFPSMLLWLGLRLGLAWPGWAGLGLAWLGWAGLGLAWLLAWLGLVWLGEKTRIINPAGSRLTIKFLWKVAFRKSKAPFHTLIA